MSAQLGGSLIISHRLHTQRLLGRRFSTPAAVVAHFGAVQGQDFLPALWALGLRTEGATEIVVEQAIEDGTILRTWPLRGTIHFVSPADARWMLNLSAERVIRGMAGRYRELGLDAVTFDHCREILSIALAGGRRLERHAAYTELGKAGISTEGQRGIHILGRLALEGLICIGPRQGKQPTFVLLDEWVPQGREMTRKEALVELARRYFTSHGPATLADYTWWSGLKVADAHVGLEAIQGELVYDEIEGATYWFTPGTDEVELTSPIAHMLPVYDEYAVAYKDRSAFLAPQFAARSDSGNGIFRAPILLDGQIVGTWTRKLKKNAVVVAANLFRSLTAKEKEALVSAVERFGAFLGLSTELVPV